jgi:glycerate dehydrogenase
VKIVVLDCDPAFGNMQPNGAVLGAVSDEPLRKLGELTLYRTTSPQQTLERCRDAEVVLTNKVVLDERILSALPRLKLVSVLATGFNVVDVKSARRCGITVCNVPGYSTASTAQHTFALLLELCHHVGRHCADVAGGAWSNSETFSYFRSPLVELSGRTLGIVGLGAIGIQVARIAAAFQMKVIAHTRTPKKLDAVHLVDKATLLEESDVISLHCPLTEDTRAFIDDKSLERTRQGALILNVARGPVVDEQAVSNALRSGHLGGFATDVLSTEPPAATNPLLSAPRCIVTPHIAWATEAARTRLVEISARNIAAFLAGAPANVVGS